MNHDEWLYSSPLKCIGDYVRFWFCGDIFAAIKISVPQTNRLMCRCGMENGQERWKIIDRQNTMTLPINENNSKCHCKYLSQFSHVLMKMQNASLFFRKRTTEKRALPILPIANIRDQANLWRAGILLINIEITRAMISLFVRHINSREYLEADLRAHTLFFPTSYFRTQTMVWDAHSHNTHG